MSPAPQANRILFIQSTTEVGGAETVLLNLLGASGHLRSRSLVATLGFGSGDLVGRLRSMGVEVLALQAGRLRQPHRALGALAAIVREGRRRRVGVVVGNGSHPQVFGSLVAGALGVPSVHFVHMIHREPIWTNEPIDVLALRGGCQLLLANSRASLEAVQRLLPRTPARLLYPGTPVRPLDPGEAARARAELGIGEGELLFGCFGRLQRWKGQDVFIEAAADVARQVPTARFAVVGGSVFGLEPEFQAGLRRRVGELGLEGQVLFTGHRSDAPRLMAACDVVCHTSRVAEPFGMVVIEAMAQARPVVATRGGGPSEIVRPGLEGLLVEPDAPGALASAMLELAADPARVRALGEAARRRVEADFSSEGMAQRFLEHLGALA